MTTGGRKILERNTLDFALCNGRDGCTCVAAVKLRLLYSAFYVCRDCMDEIVKEYKALIEDESCRN